MKSFPEITDPIFRERKYSKADNIFLNYINDKRDLPFIYLTLKLSLILIPWAVLIYLPLQPIIWWPIALGYLIISNFIFKGPFGLMLHCTSHRRFFKKQYGFMNNYLPWVLGPLFGQTPETYFTHHIGMHHPENNLEDDESTTMHYQRDSFRSFMIYFLDFIFLGIWKVTRYFKRKNRGKLRHMMIRGELLYFGLTIALCFVNLKATIIVFVLPLLISRFIMMLGNWSQHSFIDADDPGNPYKNSITCINHRYNRRCWNDGYHISHHIFPTLHWTEHPNHLMQNKNIYAENKAFIFDGAEFGMVFFMLMMKKYDKLAKYIVNINDTFSSDEEIIAIMKERTRRIPKRSETAKIAA